MGKAKEYSGHKNWNHWNVSLWINNDEGLYRMARNFIDRYPRMSRGYVATKMLERLADEGIAKTPDGAPYSMTTIQAAMRGM